MSYLELFLHFVFIDPQKIVKWVTLTIVSLVILVIE